LKAILDDAAGYVKPMLWAILLALFVKTTIAEPYRIPSSSMEDTLLIGDFVVSNKMIYGGKIPFLGWRLPAIREPRQGDIITFKWPGDGRTDYVKRCVATAGQEVQISEKVLYVDGIEFPNPEYSKFEDSNIYRSGRNAIRDNFGPYRVPEGCVFAMGDNRDRSYDSRFWGPVPLELIEGKVEIIQWSIAPDEGAPDISMADLSSIPLTAFYSALNFWGRIRWERTFDRTH